MCLICFGPLSHQNICQPIDRSISGVQACYLMGDCGACENGARLRPSAAVWALGLPLALALLPPLLLQSLDRFATA